MASDPRGDYSVATALAEPYLRLHMGKVLRLAEVVKEIFPTAPNPITTLRVEDWSDQIARRPDDMPYRIVCVYNPEFARFVTSCETGDFDAIPAATRALADKSADDIRERYWYLIDEIAVAAQLGDQKAVVSLSDERDVLARILTGRGEPIGHSA